MINLILHSFGDWITEVTFLYFSLSFRLHSLFSPLTNVTTIFCSWLLLHRCSTFISSHSPSLILFLSPRKILKKKVWEKQTFWVKSTFEKKNYVFNWEFSQIFMIYKNDENTLTNLPTFNTTMVATKLHHPPSSTVAYRQWPTNVGRHYYRHHSLPSPPLLISTISNHLHHRSGR